MRVWSRLLFARMREERREVEGKKGEEEEEMKAEGEEGVSEQGQTAEGRS